MLSHKEISERNRLLRKFFTDRDCPVDVVDMNVNAPYIVWNGTHVLSAYVKNFKLFFTTAPRDGRLLETIHLGSPEADKFDRRAIEKLILEGTHRKVCRVRLIDTDLFLVGYNFKDKDSKQGRYPVFARHGVKYYFSQEAAQEVVDDNPDYELEVG